MHCFLDTSFIIALEDADDQIHRVLMPVIGNRIS